MNTQQDALDIAAVGWPVFPCNGKRPITPHGFKDGTTDADTIREWWTDHPDATIGVALPVGTLAVDVDDAEDFEATGLPLPEAPEQQTPGGGFHRLYRVCEHACQTVKAQPGVDTRVGGKGYVIAWEAGAFRSLDLPAAPEWVYQDGQSHRKGHAACLAEWSSRPRREWSTPWHEEDEHE